MRFALDLRPLGIDPDGNARLLVVTKFFDAHGAPTRILANSDVDWRSDGTYVQWQTRMRFGQPAAIVSSNVARTLRMSVHVRLPELGTRRVASDVAAWRGPRVVAQALGPHVVAVGWFPQERRSLRIDRIESDGRRHVLVSIAGPSSSYRDATVEPGKRYRYVVLPVDRYATMLGPIVVPRAPPQTAIVNVAGKAMSLYFTTNPLDAIDYRRLDPHALIEQAIRAGLHYVELRTAYGAYWEITPQAKPTIDAIVDGLAAHGIGTIGWTVPRDASFDDLAQSVRTAYYRTARGTPLAGVALDLERGDEFMGGAPQGNDALWQYVAALRAALGPDYLIVSTVEDPYLEHLTQAQYPYEQIARFSSVLQPMSYWRMMRRRPTTPNEVRTLLSASFAKLQHVARRRIPISIDGQTVGEGANGPTSAQEITSSLATSKALGALGECFFAWDGTQPAQWAALRAYRW